ncbi:Hypothetical predicted protein [Pelobates cultripes]|uniref:Uncharacterized protein n=1 Tax=Pelobates cultripes TaxID=61616 RepID=A0AAD1SWC4_PELCU|nr:Hypothetical predicted protein [Pelobates cultripes]
MADSPLTPRHNYSAGHQRWSPATSRQVLLLHHALITALVTSYVVAGSALTSPHDYSAGHQRWSPALATSAGHQRWSPGSPLTSRHDYSAGSPLTSPLDYSAGHQVRHSRLSSYIAP